MGSTNSNISMMWIVWGSLLASVFIYGIVGYVVTAEPSEALNSEIVPTLFPILALLSVMILPLILFFRKMMLYGPLENGAIETIEQLRTRAFTPYMVSWALSESVAIYGFLLTFLSYNMDYYFGFTAWSIVLFAIFRPNMAALEEKFYRRHPELRN